MQNNKSYIKVDLKYMEILDNLGLTDSEQPKLIRFILKCVYFYDKFDSNKKYFGLVIDKEFKTALTKKQIGDHIGIKDLKDVKKFLDKMVDKKIIEVVNFDDFNGNIKSKKQNIYKFIKLDILPYFKIEEIEQKENEEQKEVEDKKDEEQICKYSRPEIEKLFKEWNYNEIIIDQYLKDKINIHYIGEIIDHAIQKEQKNEIQNLGAYVNELINSNLENLSNWAEYKNKKKSKIEEDDDLLW